MCDDFTLLLNKRLSAIIDKYKDVDDSMEPTVDLETFIIYGHESEESEPEPIPQKPHTKEFNRTYSLIFMVDNFYDLYNLLFHHI